MLFQVLDRVVDQTFQCVGWFCVAGTLSSHDADGFVHPTKRGERWFYSRHAGSLGQFVCDGIYQGNQRKSVGKNDDLSCMR
ncbi:hypothetical protein D3C75_991020 [compost metagenome]